MSSSIDNRKRKKQQSLAGLATRLFYPLLLIVNLVLSFSANVATNFPVPQRYGAFHSVFFWAAFQSLFLLMFLVAFVGVDSGDGELPGDYMFTADLTAAEL